MTEVPPEIQAYFDKVQDKQKEFFNFILDEAKKITDKHVAVSAIYTVIKTMNQIFTTLGNEVEEKINAANQTIKKE